MKKEPNQSLCIVFSRTVKLLALLFLMLPSSTQAQFVFTTNNNCLTIIAYTGPGGAVTIPSSTNGLPVTGIWFEAFSATSVTSVSIPASVTNIIEDAFGDCTNLTWIAVDVLNPSYSSANGVLFNKNQTTLLQYPGAIGGSYMIPGSVTSIGNDAFDSCSKLTSINLADVTNIGDDAFVYCTSLASVLIPNAVTSIGSGAFASCTNLQSCTMPTGLTSIADQTFEFCYALKNFTIPNGVTNIGPEAFYLCALTNVVIPGSVTSIGDGAFVYCGNLKGVNFQGNAPISVGSDVFLSDSYAVAFYQAGTSGWAPTFAGIPTQMLNAPNPNGSLQVTILPTLITTVSNGAQWQVDGGILQPSGATVLGLSVGTHTVTFTTVSDWTAPANETIFVSPDSTTITNAVYAEEIQFEFVWTTNADNTISITNYTGPGGAVTIPSYINGLAVTSIGAKAFASCISLTSVTIPNGVTDIGFAAFSACTGLTNVVIPNSVTVVERYAFSGCSELASLTIPASVSSIGDYAFETTGLISMIIPQSVTNMGSGVFAYCGKLTSVYFAGNAPTVGSYFFYQDNDPTIYYLPGTTGWQQFFSAVGLSGVPWFLPNPIILTGGASFGVQSNQFGFIVSWATNTSVVVEASINLSGDMWVPLQTNTITSGSFYFSDPQWTNYPDRFYRIRSP
jgi:BspA type Leucine rich repeat region (6 copies)